MEADTVNGRTAVWTLRSSGRRANGARDMPQLIARVMEGMGVPAVETSRADFSRTSLVRALSRSSVTVTWPLQLVRERSSQTLCR